MRVCFPMDARLEWMNRNFRCTDKIPLKVNVIDTPSIVAGSIRVSIYAVPVIPDGQFPASITLYIVSSGYVNVIAAEALHWYITCC